MATSSLPRWYRNRRIQFQPRETVSCRLLKKLVKEDAFAAAPLTVAEVGARHGSDPIWQAFGDARRVHAFEPGEDKTWSEDAWTRRVPLALWSRAKSLRIFMPEHGENASVYRPNLNFFRRLPKSEHMKIRSSFDVEATTLDAYARQTKARFDALSLDVQGAEWEILKGSRLQLQQNVLLVVAEVAFEELYRKQPLFRDVDSLLAQRRFKLFDLDLRRWSTTFKHPASKQMTGQLTYGDALYFRTPFSDPRLAAEIKGNPTRGLKLAALAEVFGAIDLSAEVLTWMGKQNIVSERVAKGLLKALSSNKILETRAR